MTAVNGYFWEQLTPEQREVAIFSHYEENGMTEYDAYQEGMSTLSPVYILPE